MSAVVPWFGGIPLSAGTRLVIDETDYLYGLGQIAVIVRDVLGIVEYRGEHWVDLEGEQELVGDARIPRAITIRLSAFPYAVRRARRTQ